MKIQEIRGRVDEMLRIERMESLNGIIPPGDGCHGKSSHLGCLDVTGFIADIKYFPG
jgi:hypothetical protein